MQRVVGRRRYVKKMGDMYLLALPVAPTIIEKMGDMYFLTLSVVSSDNCNFTRK